MPSQGLMIAGGIGQGLLQGVNSYNDARRLSMEEARARQAEARALQQEKYQNAGLLLQANKEGYSLDPESGLLTETETGKSSRDLDRRFKESQIAENFASAKSKRNEATSGKQLPPATVLSVSQGAQMPALMKKLDGIVDLNKKLFGPIENAGEFIGVSNPYNTAKKDVESTMMGAAQQVGLYMEGGKLQKEDEKKYRRMLPNLNDTSDSAKVKIKNVKEMLAAKNKADVEALKTSGYKTDGLLSEDAPAVIDPQIDQYAKTYNLNYDQAAKFSGIVAMADNIFAPPSKQEMESTAIFSPPSPDEMKLAGAPIPPPAMEQFDSQKPYYNVPAVLKQEWDVGHAPNAINAVMPDRTLMMMGPSERATGAMRSASYANAEALPSYARTAGELVAKGGGLLRDTYRSVRPYVKGAGAAIAGGTAGTWTLRKLSGLLE